MEWVEVTEKTVEAAQAAALDHLGVHESEAEFDVVSEGRPGIFGLFSQDARVRARVRPKQPRPKQERRPRKGKGGGGKGAGGRGGGGKARNSGGKAGDQSGQKSDAGAGGGRDKRAGKGRTPARRNEADQDRTRGANAGSSDGAKGGRSGRGPKREAEPKPKLDPSAADTSSSTPSSASARGPRQKTRRDRPSEAVPVETAGSDAGSDVNASADTPPPTPPGAIDGADATTSSASDGKKTTATKAGAAAAVAGTVAAQAKSSSDRRSPAPNRDDKQEEIMSTDEITVEQQGEIASDFLDGLLEAFGADGEIKSTMIEDDVIEVAVHGKDLGLMIGPKGATLHAIQELARTAVQRSGQGTHRGRLLLDVGGYRQHRRAALEQFAGQVAERVIAENKEHALEPMNSADRKAIHDAVNEIDGVKTISEGEDPRRRIVILPAD